MALLEGNVLPLSETAVLGEEAKRKLEALSITTAEEVLGLIGADPEATAEFLGEKHLAQIQAELGQEVGAEAMETLAEHGEETFALGAEPPPDIEVEERASLETFESQVLPAAPDQAAETTEPPPPAADITPCMNPIRDQEDRGTCVSFTVCAMAECLLHRERGELVDLSEQFLYCNAKGNDGKPERPGTRIEVATGLTVSDGVCLEEHWPYVGTPVPGNEGQGPAPTQAEADAPNQKLSSSIPLAKKSSQAIREVLDRGDPVALSVPVYKNWHGNAAVSTFGEIPMPLPFSQLVSGHAMCAVGYGFDPKMAGGGYFILRNSWGTDFAPLSRFAVGHALLPFLYVDLYGWESFTAAA